LYFRAKTGMASVGEADSDNSPPITTNPNTRLLNHLVLLISLSSVTLFVTNEAEPTTINGEKREALRVVYYGMNSAGFPQGE